MSFIHITNKKLKHPIRYTFLSVLLSLLIYMLICIINDKQTFVAEHEKLIHSQEKLNNISSNNKNLPNSYSADYQILPTLENLISYSNKSLLVKKLEYKQNSKSFEISGDTISINDLTNFKLYLTDNLNIKNIEIISISESTESKNYKFTFLLKGML